MKNKIYYWGFIGSILPVLGGLFKLMHLPFASILLTTGMVILAFIFFPMALRSNYVRSGKKKSILYLVICICIFIQFFSFLFKIQRWPGGDQLVIISILAPLFLFLPVYLYHHIKSEEQSLSNFFSILFLLVFFSVMDALLTIRVQKEVRDTPIEILTTANLDGYYTLKREICYRHLSTGSAKQKEVLLSIKVRAESLHNIIKLIREEILFQASRGENKSAQPLDYYKIKLMDNQQIPWNAIDICRYDKGCKLREEMIALEKTLSDNLPAGSESAKFVSDILKGPGNNDRWEEQMFKGCPVVFALYQLNILDEKINLAELESLKSFRKNI